MLSYRLLRVSRCREGVDRSRSELSKKNPDPQGYYLRVQVAEKIKTRKYFGLAELEKRMKEHEVADMFSELPDD